MSESKCSDLWIHIIKKKIGNQSKALEIMGLSGSECVSKYIDGINEDNVDLNELVKMVYSLSKKQTGCGTDVYS